MLKFIIIGIIAILGIIGFILYRISEYYGKIGEEALHEAVKGLDL